MTIKITNLSGSTFTTSLYHDQYCVKGAECKCKDATLTRSVPKGSGVTHTRKKLSASLSITPKQTVSGLHDAVAELPHVIDAQKCRHPVLKVVQEKIKEIAVEVKPEPPADAPVSINDDTTESVQQSENAQEQRSFKSAKKKRGRSRSSKKETLNG